MNSDELTSKLPDDRMTTHPTIETVLERINALAGRIGEFQTKFETEIAALRTEVIGMRTEFSTLQTSMGKGFRRLERFDGVLGDQMRKMEVDHRDLADRVDLIESKLS